MKQFLYMILASLILLFFVDKCHAALSEAQQEAIFNKIESLNGSIVSNSQILQQKLTDTQSQDKILVSDNINLKNLNNDLEIKYNMEVLKTQEKAKEASDNAKERDVFIDIASIVIALMVVSKFYVITSKMGWQGALIELGIAIGTYGAVYAFGRFALSYIIKVCPFL